MGSEMCIRDRLLVDWYVSECEMVDSSLSCVSSSENVTPSAMMAFDFTPASIFAGGDGIVRHIRSVTKNQERKQVHYLIVDLFGRHAEPYALTAEEKTA